MFLAFYTFAGVAIYIILLPEILEKTKGNPNQKAIAVMCFFIMFFFWPIIIPIRFYNHYKEYRERKNK